jgi:hypothetical protein
VQLFLAHFFLLLFWVLPFTVESVLKWLVTLGLLVIFKWELKKLMLPLWSGWGFPLGVLM